MSVQDVFDKYASDYDASRKKLIPCFDDFYQIALDAVPFTGEDKLDVLDLGAGTGLMAEMVASRFPKARIDLIDIAEKMLSEARNRLKGYQNELRFLVSNYAASEALKQQYDVVISSLSVHHLTDEEKQQLFNSIFVHLRPGGMFINADQVFGESEKVDRICHQQWVEQVKAKGTTDEELDAALERMKEDNMATLSSQLHWLKEAGFCDVTCWYKNYSFVVFSGRKGCE